MDIKKYSWTFDERDDIWTSDTFDTIKECVEDAKQYMDSNPCERKRDHIFVGENVPFTPHVNAEDVLELIENDACDKCGEVANDWYSYDSQSMTVELAKLSLNLTSVVTKWLKENNREPFFYSIRDVKKVFIDNPPDETPEVCGG